ncbi:MAG: DUF1648 domain-containing protein [Bryobacteraceae bacterium]|nr:DUF5808 domain-containing protein [Bryobacterales bacterium]MEB2360672.1 DUF5808 domain-containing protein [Bryobacterales bacterium]NUN03224.1 DUF1648 domain-containing protein [Bryobacteraceae bacterium]
MIRLSLLLPLAATFAFLHVLPFLPYRDRLFGVAVPPEVRYGSEGRRALRRYELHLLPWTATTFFVPLWLPLSWAAIWMSAASLLPVIAAGRIFWRTRGEIQHLALPAPSTREAQLADTDNHLQRQILLFLIPMAILAGTAVYLHLHWDQIPPRFPVHWGTDGTPNGWSTRSFAGVYGPLLFGAIIVLFILGISVVISWGSRRSALQSTSQLVLLAVACIVAAGGSLAGLLPIYVTPVWGVMVFNAASFGLIAVAIWFSVRRRGETASEPGEVTPESCWHCWGQFYHNPQDPVLFVEKRIGLGWTLNFGNRLSWAVLALMLAVPPGLIYLVLQFTKS